jgi:zinc protease
MFVARGFARTLAAVLVLGAGLASAPKSEAASFRADSFTLKNGLQVVVIPDHRSPVVVQMVWYKVGGADEPPLKSGLAHFLEHLMFKGTKKLPGKEFALIVARNGGQDNAFTAPDYTGYWEKVAKDRLPLVMSMEADRMTGLVLNDVEDVNHELQVVIQERRMRTDNNPQAQLQEEVQATLFTLHPYRIPTIGWLSEVEKLTRDEAVDFYRHHYAPNNAILVLAGDVTVDDVKPLAEKYYGPLKRGEIPPRVRPEEPPHLAAKRVIMTDAKVRQPTWQRQYIAPSLHRGDTKQAVPLDVLSEILGGGPTSRLYKKLVIELGVAAGVGAGYQDTAFDLSTFDFYGTPVPGGDVKDIEAETDKVIADVLKNGVTQEEVDRAKKSLIASAVYAQDSAMGLGYVYGGALAVGLTIDDVATWPDQVQKVTVEQVNEAARQVFKIQNSVTGMLLPEPKPQAEPQP